MSWAEWGPPYEEEQLARPNPADQAANLTAEYLQEPGEATRAFLERIERRFAQDIGGSWDEWTQRMRRLLVKRFLEGLQEDTHYGVIAHDTNYLAHKNWAELTDLTHRMDQPWPGSNPTSAQDALGAHSSFQQTVFALQQYTQDPWGTPDSQASSGPSSPSLHASGNHFIPFNSDHARPQTKRRRRRRRAKGNAPSTREQRMSAFKDEVNVIKQLVNQMASDMSQVRGRLRAPWGGPNNPPRPNWAGHSQQVTPAPPPYPLGCKCCTHHTQPAPGAVNRYPDNPNWGTHAHPGGGPNLPPDADIFDSGYERDPTHAFEDPEEEPEEEIDNEFTRACAQGLRRLFQPRQVPRETTGWAAPLPGHVPHDGEPDWGEDPNQPAWSEGEAQPDPAPPTGRNHRPELWDDEDDEELPSGRDRRPELWDDEDDEDIPHSAQFTDPRLARTLKEAPRGAGAPNDGGVPYCAQFATPRLPTKTRKPPEDEGGVPYCAQFADEDAIAAALRERKRWGGKSERGEDASTLPPDLAAPSRPDPGPAPPRPPTDSAHFRDPAEDQEEPPSQDTQGPAENDQTTHDLPVLDCDEAELEAMVAELNEYPNADPDAAETPAGGQQRGGVFTVPKLLAILFGMVTTFATTDAHCLAVPNGTSASPARPELRFYRMYDGSHVTCEEDGSATTTWTLILLQ